MLYLTVAWWMAGRSIGDHVWGVRVTSRSGVELGLARAFVRAVACAVFPVGLLWCAIDRDRRSLQDLVLRTSVVYDWMSHPSGRWGGQAGLRTPRHPATEGTSASIESVGVFNAMPVPIVRSFQTGPSRNSFAMTSPVSRTPSVRVKRASSVPSWSTRRQ